MNNIYDEYLSKPILTGKIVEAEYQESLLSDYNGNPFIEALPGILSPRAAIEKMRFHPNYSEEERHYPAHLRIHCVERLSDLIEPINKHIEVEQFFSRVIRHGYISRNPLSKDNTILLNLGSEAIRVKDVNYVKSSWQSRSTACGQVILGMSGIGKSTVVESVLLQYPQVIIHSKYIDRNLFVKQVVWLKLECPYDGGIKGLCLKFFKAFDNLLGTSYYSKFAVHKSTEEMLPAMAQVATLHGLGMLIIDEIQNLDQAKSGGEKKMLNFLVELINTFSLPVVIIGTYKADFLFNSAFRDARRGTGQLNPFWHRMSNDKEWEAFINVIWKYQWTKNISELTPSIINTLYEESQGIIDIAIKLFKLAQWRAITTRRDIINEQLISSVASDHFKLIRPMLDAIKSGKEKELGKYEDIYLPSELFNSIKNDSIKSAKSAEEKTKLSRNSKRGRCNENIVLISEIASWLTQAGVNPDKSEQIAVKTIEIYGQNAALSELKKNAFVLASMDQNEVSNEQKPPSQTQENSLPNILKQAESSGKKVSDVLIDCNIIKDPNEFIS